MTDTTHSPAHSISDSEVSLVCAGLMMYYRQCQQMPDALFNQFMSVTTDVVSRLSASMGATAAEQAEITRPPFSSRGDLMCQIDDLHFRLRGSRISEIFGSAGSPKC